MAGQIYNARMDKRTKPPVGKIRVTPAPQTRADQILTLLKTMYPDAHCALNHRSAWELLVATILSAQCTDVRVNMVTPALFKRFPDAPSFATAELADIEHLIKSTGFFRAKAKAIQHTARQLVALHGGQVPESMEELTALRGVGRKTANVVLGNAFGKQVGIVVDTHVGRLSRRLGLSRHEDPEKVENDLMRLIPQDHWTLFSHLLISHGRAICAARKPECDKCRLSALCPAAFKPDRGRGKSAV